MRQFFRNIANRVFNRLTVVSLSMLLQILTLIVLLVHFRQQYALIQTVTVFLAFVLTVHIVSGNRNAAYKIAWLIPILALPLFGTLIYFLFGRRTPTPAQKLRNAALERKRRLAAAAETPAVRVMEHEDPAALRQARYLENAALAPLYTDTQTEYLSPGEALWERMLAELERAERFIFLEYYIIAEGSLWDELCTLLLRKRAEGVEVRVIYDDLGSIRRLPYDFAERLEKKGIPCRVFHRFRPILTGSFNSRDHRKILVVDGRVAFTGGLNLADEYVNRVSPYGHWLDAGLMLRGPAVWSFTVMFLSMWENLGPGDADYNLYRARPETPLPPGDGYVQPFADEPLDDEPVGKLAYQNLISRAERYVYMCTPYFIPDNELVTALAAAVKSGVDVRIITPGVPDKWFVHAVTRACYRPLLRAGVRIFEYTPGFLHSKTIVCDDAYAICGSMNFDYRSMYLQHECGVWMYHSRAVGQICRDFLGTLEKCTEITREMAENLPLHRRILQELLRAFSPLM